MIGGFQNIGKIPELKKRILFSLFMIGTKVAFMYNEKGKKEK